MKNWSGERLETFIYTRDTIDHIHRYALVSSFIENKIILDIASGEGYGSNLMSEKASFVYGVDLDEMTITEARQKYKNKNLEFLVGSTSAIPLNDSSIDVVISFETIEHHDKHHEMMIEIKRVLKREGILIISTPDKLYYSDKRKFSNKFHIKELYKNEFVELVSDNFKFYQLFTQHYFNGNSIILEDKNQDKTLFYTGEYSQIQQIESCPLYLIAIASDDLFQEKNDSIFEGSQILKLEIKNQIKNESNKVYNSNSYRLGNFILRPFSFIKKMLK
ncbi:class I SAM-dependent methyltransferase [Gelidibacter salicanalis]|uniref:Class I SAM-dependent methyltransferase n=1 Tax=Gelidibacter salicanalis TaxID=291193 RepID=A0A934KUR4_9FLAO|nr:class I SAM-dependent methyltransferase [Gelidibacter salicanalis]MBJ7880583.1 class I SAM-dependent methyltransferase [Gelidibacter salicanalis]